MNHFATQTSAFASPVEQEAVIYDAAIVGGGLAGLALAIQLAKENFRVIVIEKEIYPFHRVCGEYISFESWNFLESIGYPLSDMDLPVIKNLVVSAPNGNKVAHALTLGGFGISRYKIDAELAQIARESGAIVQEDEKVKDIFFNDRLFSVKCDSFTVKARVVAAAFGKRSNLDVKWKRSFAVQKPGKFSNYIGVKYHIKTDEPADTIALHNFADGYCGISQIENNNYCLCYLTTARNLKKSDNSIATMEKNILFKNPVLKKIFSTATFIRKEPVTIAQISFTKKTQVEDHILMIGDAAGMITPLCGNGMSMALHASKLAADSMTAFLRHKITRQEMESAYSIQWNICFAKRLRTGRFIQRMFGSVLLTNLFIAILKPFPKIIAYLMRQTHGEPF
ncbi:MAG TPA: FAD-dependent monooxygenase [Chitinophagaceae bacterium]|jgi:menaquinone-9 beta-reductase|nr:FAD-dependent monooxygenase [Chitinophagaceae bacterium]